MLSLEEEKRTRYSVVDSVSKVTSQVVNEIEDHKQQCPSRSPHRSDGMLPRREISSSLGFSAEDLVPFDK